MTDLHPLPPVVADERTTLVEFLDYFRSVLLRKADGLDETTARQRVGTSAMDMLGLVRHLALVEQWWFSQALGQRRTRRVAERRRPRHRLASRP